jgi:hypothetical protein
MELEQQTAKAHWLRADVQPREDAPVQDQPVERTQSHFVEPYRFEGAARAELMHTLEASGLGDEPSRRLFVAALEFEIGNLLQQAMPPPEPHRPEPDPVLVALERIGQRASALIGLLEAADSDIRKALTRALGKGDRYRRSYNQRYLQELENELRSLEQACAPERPPTESSAPAADRQFSESFIASLAETYRECFEVQPTIPKTGPFSRVARKILQLTGLPVRFDQKLLKVVLAR